MEVKIKIPHFGISRCTKKPSDYPPKKGGGRSRPDRAERMELKPLPPDKQSDKSQHGQTADGFFCFVALLASATVSLVLLQIREFGQLFGDFALFAFLIMRFGGVDFRLDGDAVTEFFSGFFCQFVGGISRSFILVDSLGKSPLLLIFILNLAHNAKIVA